MSEFKTCPYCGNTHCWADEVDVGVGWLQSSPYGCEECYAIEIQKGYNDESATPEEIKIGWLKGQFVGEKNE